MTPKFTAKKTNLYPPDHAEWHEYLFLPEYEEVRLERWLNTFKDGQKVDIIIRKHRNQRTDSQNSYYWGVVVYMLSNELGYTKDEVHEAMKEKFASQKDEHGLTIIQSTAKMSIERFAEYIEDIKRWASEYLSFYIPDPNEVA